MLWRILAKATGNKSSMNEKEADIIALVRIIVIFSYITTNAFIIAGVIRHWQKEKPTEASCVIYTPSQI